MMSPDYLKRPPEKEAVLVEHSTKHTIVLKPGFYNRRNQSALLKSSFPAGFQIKNKLTDRLGESIVNDGRHIKPYQSFTDWTKGESDTHEDSVSADLTDPYADVAGPYLAEILANRPKLDRPSYDASKHSSVIATEVELHHRTKKSNKPKLNSPSKPHVFNAPALLPTFTPALSHNKVVNNLVPVNTSAYESWLATQRSDQAEKFWLIKGNAEEYNYSSHDFAGDVSTTSQLLTAAGAMHPVPTFEEETESHIERLRTAFPTLMMELPRPLPPHITIEVHTMNQLVRTDKLCEDKHIVRTIDSQLPLQDLRALITEEIIGGIERAFRIVSGTGVNTSTRTVHRNYNKVDLTFQVFSPQAHTWRSVASEVDWTQAKLSCRNEQNVLRVMYALEKKSEFLLLKEIQQSFQRAREAEKVGQTPQISLKALTESMETSLRLKKKYVFTDSPPASPGPLNAVPRKSRTATPSTAPRHRDQESHMKHHATLPGPPPTYFLPLGQSVTKLAALSGGKGAEGSMGSMAGTLLGMSRQPSRLDPLTRTSSEHDGPGGLSGHSTASAQSLMGIRPSHSANITLADSSPAGTMAPSAGQGSKSIFYPKRSQSLDLLYEQLESSIPRQQDFANTLEQRLFKTKW